MKLDEIIRLIREIALIGTILAIGWRVVFSDFSVNVGDLSATDIVALLLALFSVALSAAFYFKATDSSNKFYDNMHKFTQDTSVLLGKIDAGFGEQLKNIEQKSQDLKDSVDRYYSASGKPNQEEIAQEKEAAEKQVSASKQEFENLIETIFEKSKIDETEKAHLKSSLQKKERELEVLHQELDSISNREKNKIEDRIHRHLSRVFSRELKQEGNSGIPAMEFILGVISSGNSAFLHDLYRYGYISSRSPKTVNDITKSGEQLFMSVLDDTLKNA
ncbi:hypothetical protein ACU6DI_004126 [Vibrio navarrensis]|nr:hypothetical protein [Vibrio vulnificus]